MPDQVETWNKERGLEQSQDSIGGDHKNVISIHGWKMLEDDFSSAIGGTSPPLFCLTSGMTLLNFHFQSLLPGGVR